MATSAGFQRCPAFAIIASAYLRRILGVDQRQRHPSQTGVALSSCRRPRPENSQRVRRGSVSRFKVVTPEGVSFGPPDVGYDSEMEALAPVGASIVEIPPGSEEDFVRAARDADALYAKARRITKGMIDGLERCRVIALGTVGVDSVDVVAASARGIPVTNVPDTFIEEVADHALMLLLATYRRLTLMDRYVHDGRWAEGRPYL